ncbi:MAG TPA: heme exporter protein CcmD [Casimicrobiaceae bacterium]
MMEHYAFFLVGAYGMFALAIVVEVVAVRARLRHARLQRGTPR